MTTITPGLPPGQYSAGSVQVRAVEDGIGSAYTPLGPMISPYQVAGSNVDVFQPDINNTQYTLTGVGQIGATVDILDPANTVIVTGIVDIYGHYSLVVNVPPASEGLTYSIRMTSPDGTEVSLELPMILPRTTYDYAAAAVTGDVTINPTPTGVSYTEDGGETWTDSAAAAIPVADGIYTQGTIRVRNTDGTGPEAVESGIISPYLPRDIRSLPGSTQWAVSGTGDIGSTISLTDVGGTTLASGTVNEYGEFQLLVDNTSVNTTDTYTLTMTQNGLTGAIDITFADFAPPQAEYQLDASNVPVIAITDTRPNLEYTFNGGITWNPVP